MQSTLSRVAPLAQVMKFCPQEKSVDDKLQGEGNVNRFLDTLQQELLQLDDGTIVKLGKRVKSQEMPLPATSKKGKCKETKKEMQPSRKSTRHKIKPQKLQEGWDSEERGLVTRVGAGVDMFWTDNDLEGTELTAGWYEVEVEEYDDDEDVICVL